MVKWLSLSNWQFRNKRHSYIMWKEESKSWHSDVFLADIPFHTNSSQARPPKSPWESPRESPQKGNKVEHLQPWWSIRVRVWASPVHQCCSVAHQGNNNSVQGNNSVLTEVMMLKTTARGPLCSLQSLWQLLSSTLQVSSTKCYKPIISESTNSFKRNPP